MPGLDPGIHLLRKTLLRRSMDCRVKPGNDCGWDSMRAANSVFTLSPRSGERVARAQRGPGEGQPLAALLPLTPLTPLRGLATLPPLCRARGHRMRGVVA